MAVAARNTLRTDSWDKVYAYLQTTNPISTSNIFSAFNSRLLADNGYPLVIIHPPLVSYDRMNVTGALTSSEINMLIEVYENTSAKVKALADNVTTKLIAGKDVFSSDGLKRMNIEQGSFDTWQDGKKKVHRMGFTISFRFVSD